MSATTPRPRFSNGKILLISYLFPPVGGIGVQRALSLAKYLPQSGFEVYVLKATPRKGYKPPDRDSEVLTGMEGTLWIDQRTFQWVKVEAHVFHPVKIEGFLATVEPGTRFELEKRPVSGDIWMASHFSMRSNAKVLLLFPHKGEEDDLYFHYHKVESTTASK